MSKEQIEQHFIKYSKTYAKNKKFELASFEDMALKTVLTQLLRRWGIMTTELQNAYESDQAVLIEDQKIYIDNPNNKDNIPTNNNQEIINTPTIQPITINESIPQNTFNFEQEQEKLESLNLD